MPTFTVTRLVTTVQRTVIEAPTYLDAQYAAEYNPHLLDWRDSSQNDPVIIEIQEKD